MLHHKCIVTLLVMFVTVTHLVEAVEQYVASFVAGRTRIGLVFIKQTDTAIEASQASFIPTGKNLGSTAVLAQMGWWDYGIGYDVLVITVDASKPLEVALIRTDGWKKIEKSRKLSQAPGQYHPLHLFQVDWSDSACCRIGNLLTAGTFGTSGANNYVSHLIDGTTKRIFVNADDRSPGTAAVAPDGGMVSQMTYKGVKHTGLIGVLSKGKLAGSPIQWLNVNAFHGYSQSLSNPIEESPGTRYLAYRNFREPGTTNSQSKVMIQKVDAQTGRPKGVPRSITNFAKSRNVDAEKSQSIAISSNGGLILYTAWSNQCKKQILLARTIVNGSSAGDSRVVVGCQQLEEFPLGIYGISITESEPERF